VIAGQKKLSKVENNDRRSKIMIAGRKKLSQVENNDHRSKTCFIERNKLLRANRVQSGMHFKHICT
jgi:hypothetical protein